MTDPNVVDAIIQLTERVDVWGFRVTFCFVLLMIWLPIATSQKKGAA